MIERLSRRGDRAIDRRPLVASVLLFGLGGLSACGDIEDQSLCPVYEDLRAQQAVVRDIDLDATSAGEAAEVAEDYLESVQRLQEVVDDRYARRAGGPRGRLDDVLRTLESVPDDADDSTWAPLVGGLAQDAATPPCRRGQARTAVRPDGRPPTTNRAETLEHRPKDEGEQVDGPVRPRGRSW